MLMRVNRTIIPRAVPNMDVSSEKLARTTRPPAIRPITSGNRKRAVGYPNGSHD
ncbi:hypothetical protein YSY22_55400 [Brevibacillus formosus]